VGILSPLRRLIAFARQQFQRLVNWARGGLRYVSTNFRTLAQRLIRFLGVVLDGLRQLIAIVVNPFGIVGFLAGTLWRLIPECLKGPLIDFILDILIRLVRAIPPLPTLGLLWPLIRSSLLGFFERVRSFATARKVAVSNKIARIVSGMSPSFAFGYLRGLALGVWDGITAPFQAIAAIFELPAQFQAFLANLGLRLCDLIEQIRCFAAQLAGRVFGTLDDILGALRELLADPGRILELIRCAIEGALAAAHSLGASIADQLMAVFESAEEAIGEQLGRITGSVLIQAVIAYFTAGAGAAVGVIGQISRALSTVGRAVGTVLRTVGRLLGRLVSFLRGLASRFASAVARGGRSVLSRLGGFFRRVALWLRRLLGRMFRGLRRRFGLTAAERLQWIEFRGALRARLAGYATTGIRRSQLRGVYRGVLNTFRRVAKWPAFITKHGPNWRLWVRRVKSIRPRIVGRVLLDHATREREGWKAVRRAVRQIKRRPGLMRSTEIRAALPRIQRRFRFSSLSVSYDSAREDFAIRGEMSPGNNWRTDPERPPRNNVNVVVSGRHVIVDPLVRASATRSAPWGTPTGWPSIERIKTRSGRTSLYIKGHLVSGFFAGGSADNLTPITRNANGAMAAQIETPTKRLLRRRRNRPVFKYEAHATGRSSAASQRRRVLSGSSYVWIRIPAERALARTITVTRTEYGFDDSAGRWSRRKGSVSARVTNVPDRALHPPTGYPKGYGE
jgi:phage-related protein